MRAVIWWRQNPGMGIYVDIELRHTSTIPCVFPIVNLGIITVSTRTTIEVWKWRTYTAVLKLLQVYYTEVTLYMQSNNNNLTLNYPRTRSCGSCHGTPRILNISSSVSEATSIPVALFRPPLWIFIDFFTHQLLIYHDDHGGYGWHYRTIPSG